MARQTVKILIAFDKFKNSLTAGEACGIAAREIRSLQPHWQLSLCPLSDGGEGFARILTDSAAGEWKEVPVTGPRGREVVAGFGMVPAGSIPPSARAMLEVFLNDADPVGVVEMAAASGLELLSTDERDPWKTDTRGTGQLMQAAAEAGARAILLGVGGSATNDLGLGALAELGIQPVDPAGVVIHPAPPSRWNQISGFQGRLPEGFPPVFIACDVHNPLLGDSGCASVYGPQKGLRPDDLPSMEAAATRLAGLLTAHFGLPGSLPAEPGMGAAGGIAFGLRCAASARLIPGADFVACWLDLARHLADCDRVITGEGRFDSSSLQGKGPGELVRHASASGKPVIILAGSTEKNLPLPPGTQVIPISPDHLPLPEALKQGPHLLARAIQELIPRL